MVTPTKEAYDLDHFSLKDMTECGMALRKMGKGATCLEEVAQKSVEYLFDTLVSGQLEGKACTLVRSFMTVDYELLPDDLKEAARSGKKDKPSDTRCLVLMGSRGIKVEWNDRHLSKHHKAMALNSAEFVKGLPMIAELMTQLGVDVAKVVAPGPKFLIQEKNRNFNVFHVPDAANAAAIPDQENFVKPHQIKSVVGYGGLLPSGSMFCVVLFMHAGVSHQTALAFRPFALNTKIALLPFDEPDLLFSRT